MDNKNEITETDLVEVAMPEVTSEENPKSKTEAAGKKPERKKKKISKGAIAVIVVAALVIGGLTVKTFVDSFKQMKEAMGDIDSKTDDNLFTVDREDVEQELTTSGTVVGIGKDAYISPVTAKVEDVCVEVGQTVQKGDVLLTYDSSDLGDNLTKVKIQAQSEKAAGDSNYEAADEAAEKAGSAQKKVKKLEKEVASLKKDAEKLSDSITSYQDKMEEAEAQNAKETEKAATPNEQGTTREPNLQDTKELKQTIRDLNKKLNKKNEALSEKQSQLAEQQSIVAANKDVKVSESTKAQLAASNELSNLNVSEAEKSLSQAEAGLTANADGIVESVDVVQGAYANETQTVMTIIKSDEIGVEFTISKDDLGYISNGQTARVVIGNNEYEGTVEFVSRVASMDATAATAKTTGGNIKGRIRIKNPDGNIYIGVSAKAYIFIGKADKALVIPYEALCTDIDGDYVYVVDKNNKIQRKDVKVGIYSDEYYEVTEGMAEGDKVIRNVTKDMKPGDEYVPETAASAVAPGIVTVTE